MNDCPTERILFSGMVQGVGFRWTTSSLARQLPLKGTVRNLADGRVEVIACGPMESVETLIHQLRQEFGAKIEGVERESLSGLSEFSDFRISY